MPNDEINNDLEAARERARLAMEGEERKNKKIEEEKINQEKRLSARLAMEGAERRARREAKEKEIKEKEIMRQRIDDEVKRRVEETAKKKQAEETAKKNEQSAREQQLKQKENEFIESRNVIEQLKKEKGSSINPLRTLQSDLAGAIKTENLSQAKIAIAEQEKKPIVTKLEKSSSSIGKIILGFFVLLLLFSLGGGAYWYWSKNSQAIIKNAPIQSIIHAEASQEINTSNLPSAELVTTISNLIANSKLAGETITNIYFTKEVLASDGKTKTKSLLNFSEFLTYSQSAIPANFSRFVNTYMLGLYGGTNGNSIFLTLKIDLHDNVSQEFLDHENDYLQNIFKSLDGKDLTGTSTPQTFTDRLLKNIKTRVLLDEQGKVLLVYSFIDRTTLIIAQSEEALYRAYVAYNTPKLKN